MLAAQAAAQVGQRLEGEPRARLPSRARLTVRTLWAVLCVLRAGGLSAELGCTMDSGADLWTLRAVGGCSCHSVNARAPACTRDKSDNTQLSRMALARRRTCARWASAQTISARGAAKSPSARVSR